MDKFIHSLNQGFSISKALKIAKVTNTCCKFINFTFKILKSKQIHKIAAAFVFGRENIISDMFIRILTNSEESLRKNKMIYYLERHIDNKNYKHAELG